MYWRLSTIQKAHMSCSWVYDDIRDCNCNVFCRQNLSQYEKIWCWQNANGWQMREIGRVIFHFIFMCISERHIKTAIFCVVTQFYIFSWFNGIESVRALHDQKIKKFVSIKRFWGIFIQSLTSSLSANREWKLIYVATEMKNSPVRNIREILSLSSGISFSRKVLNSSW